MIVEPIGLIFLLAGFLILWTDAKTGFYLLGPSMLLGAAAASLLGALLR